eukprot:6737902-Pyramimonas_sp.AAC.1
MLQYSSGQDAGDCLYQGHEALSGSQCTSSYSIYRDVEVLSNWKEKGRIRDMLIFTGEGGDDEGGRGGRRNGGRQPAAREESLAPPET